ncbi:hypothetical protein HZH66_001942 [Vespula vulgaris]|uniref:CHK kinase-like domain-containing protein n=1 Tax=Vespula vulgaris TaxID=7454 RepID=A0A834NFS2_VESVU|nr:uncharacterized protein LOC127072843 [Vespula vulgaris]KAF7407405.1 hypothetical protein HZH66_001942 [Vespula vulgaris]
MSDVEHKIKEHFKVLVPKLMSYLRDDYYKYEYELERPNDSIFFSGTFYMRIKFWINDNNDVKDKNKTNKNKEKTIIMRLVAKTPITTEAVQQLMRANDQFYNEIIFYRNYATEGDNIPKCYYTNENDLFGATLVLEDITTKGYKIHPKKVDIPLDDILPVMKEIARFHAKGYVMKEKHPEKFVGFIETIKECRYDANDNDPNSHYVYLLNHVTCRPINYLRKINYDNNFCDKLEECLKNAYRKILLKTIEPVEPLAVLCHGDLTINNMLFKKDEKDTRVMLIDFALIRYGSPAIDLSTFLCLSCSNQVKCENLPIVLRTYHDELTRCLKENGLTNLEKYSFEAFWNDYVEHALFGYTVCSYFLHTLMNEDLPPLPDILDKKMEDLANIVIESGGDKITIALANILIDLKELGCFNKILS